VTRTEGPVLLDTNIVLQLARGNDYGRRIEATYRLQTRPFRPLISIVTAGELLAFARRRGWGVTRVQTLNEIMGQFVVIDINRPVIERYADIHAFLVSSGKAVGDNDVWIAATASATSSLLITTDKDFDSLAGIHVELSRFDLAPEKG
jgi:tRNA(fMet)-specific endonuclease VapC